MIKDYFHLAYQSAKKRKLRSWLTMISIFIGIAAVVSLISLSQGMQKAVDGQFRKLGPDKLTVRPGGVSLGVLGSEILAGELTEHDAHIIKKVEGVEIAGETLIKNTKINFEGEADYSTVLGIPTTSEYGKVLEEVGFLSCGEGRQLKETDKYKAVIGYELAYKSFKRDINLRDKIEIEGREFKVVGIQKKAGNALQDKMIRIPLAVARELFNEPQKISAVYLKVKEGFVPQEVAEKIKKEMRKDRGLKKGEEDFSVTSEENIVKRMNTILGVIQAILVGIAAISLLVAGIGIMTTMFTSVLERTKQIGIMKAVGAKNRDITLLFLIESGLLGLFGGALGVALGIGISKAVELIAFQFGVGIFKAAITPQLVVKALLFALTVGIISGILPAGRAVKLKPLDALRGK